MRDYTSPTDGRKYDPGVSGLSQLGRNAIERVAELERENAALRAELTRIGEAPTIATIAAIGTGRYVRQMRINDELPAVGTELIARARENGA